MKMANHKKSQQSVLLLLAIAVALVSAEPPRYRQHVVKFQQPRRPFLAKQELAPAAPAPYPSADDLKPAVPFEEGVQPDQTYGPPDQTYGPPDQTYGPPDQTYGPPEAAPGGGEQLPSAEVPQQFAPNPDAEEFLPIAQTARFIRRRPQKQRIAKLQAQPQQQLQAQPQPQLILKSAPLVAAPATAPLQLSLASLPLEQYSYYVVNQPFSYSAQFQTW